MKLFKFLGSLLPHGCIILSLMMLTLFVTDRFNRAMAFLDNEITKWILFCFSILVIVQSVLQIVLQRRELRRKAAEKQTKEMELTNYDHQLFH